jgi:signal transduction histidine kinase
VWLPAGLAHELGGAVAAAVENVRRHCPEGVRMWILVEDEPGGVVVTVRDEGPGIPAGRLDQAAAQGRLGVAQSIRGRLADLGGTATITSAPGQGTEVELRLGRPASVR